MGRRRRRAAAALILLALLLSGCWDRLEIEDAAYITVLGLDHSAAGRLLVTTRVTLVPGLGASALAAASPAPGPTSQLITAEADTITQALLILNGAMTRRLDIRHLRGVLVGEELARAGLEPVLMELLRSPLVRGSALLVQIRGRALENMEVFSPVAEINPARVPEGVIMQAKHLHMGPPVRMHHFMARLAAPGGDPFLPVSARNPGITAGRPQPPQPPADESALPGELPRGGGNPVEFVGSAVFRRDRLQGYLNVDETQMLLALRGEMGKAYLTFPDPDAPGRAVTLRFHQENLPQYSAYFRGGRPRVEARLFFEGEVLAVPGGTDYVRPAARERLERAAAAFARRTLRGLLQKLREWEADPVGFGHLFRGQFATWADWEEYNWRDHVKDLTVTVDVVMRIRRYGLYTGPDRAGEGR